MVIGHVRRRAYYDVEDLQVFNRGLRGGIYWFWHGINLRGMLVWIVAATVGLLCSSNSWYVGPGATALGGVDVSFVAAGLAAPQGCCTHWFLASSPSLASSWGRATKTRSRP